MKVHKVEWPKGRNMKPQPKGTSQQQIPTATTPVPSALKAARAERKLMVEKGLFPTGEPMAPPMLEALPMEPRELLAFNRTWLQTEQQARVQRLAEAMCLRQMREDRPMTATEARLREQEWLAKLPTLKI